MAAEELTEGAVNLIIATLKANLPTALADLRAERGDQLVGTDPPKNTSYFISQQDVGYICPAIFVIPEDMDFRLANKNANFIDALIRMNVAISLEDRNSDRLTIKAYRYQAAVHKVLVQESLTTGSGQLTLKIKVEHASYTPVYTIDGKKGEAMGVFRKEVTLKCSVEHYENY